MKLKLGKNKINDKKNKIKKSVDPGYYKMFEIKTTMPGASILHIGVYQYKMFGRDKLIGETTIDLENRYYS